MKDGQIPGSRRRFCLSDLFRRRRGLRGAGSLLLLCYLLSPPAFLGSCRKLPPPAEEVDPSSGAAAVDTVTMRLKITADRWPVRRLDVFCYGAEGTQQLVLHERRDSLPELLDLDVPEGGKAVVCIANSPHDFNLGALARFDAMAQLSYGFRDDDPQAPVLGGWAEMPDSGGELVLQPLLCRVVLTSVANTMDGYELLEDPRVRLRDLPDAAEILRERDFRPTELIDSGPWVPLPCDVGYFPQEPQISLWCYPNDTPEHILGTPRPTLEFECTIRGEACSFDVPLPPLPRAGTLEVSLTVNGPDDFRYKIQ